MVDDFRPIKRPAKPAKKFLTQIPPAKTRTKEAEPAFKPPQEVAEAEEQAETPSRKLLKLNVDLPPVVEKIKKTGSGLSRFKPSLHWPPSRQEYIGLAIIVALTGIGVWGYLHMHAPKQETARAVTKVTKKAAPTPTTVPSNLTGLPVDPSVNKRPVTGVMVENSLDARPQSGLSQAGVVFEAIAEGGVTRFMALFQDTQPDNVGPIRSARPYYVAWALGFDAGYAHVGGSPDGLQDIRDWGVRDLDQFANGSYYHRTSDRIAPHNVYTGIPTLTELEAAKGYTGSSFTGFARKKETPSKQPTATSIDFGLSGPLYDPHYDYTAATNSYNRNEYGSPHIDANNNQQISPKVVVAIVVTLGQGELDSSGAYYSDYNVLGSGTAYVFQDGTVTVGQWNKADVRSSLSFTGSDGKPLKFNPGQTWITAVSDSSKVSYQ